MRHCAHTTLNASTACSLVFCTCRWDPYVDGLVGELRKIKGSDMQVLVNGCVCTDSACSKYDRSPLLATCDKAAAA